MCAFRLMRIVRVLRWWFNRLLLVVIIWNELVLRWCLLSLVVFVCRSYLVVRLIGIGRIDLAIARVIGFRTMLFRRVRVIINLLRIMRQGKLRRERVNLRLRGALSVILFVRFIGCLL